jgi:hypothetical protein
LRGELPEPIVNLQAILNETYRKGRLDLPVDYATAPVPDLNADDRDWMNALAIA